MIEKTEMLSPLLRTRLSAQRALLGQITPNLRAVALSAIGHEVAVKFYFDGEISVDDLENASCVETEMLADYEKHYSVTVQCVRFDFPQVIGNDGFWVYNRKEIGF